MMQDVISCHDEATSFWKQQAENAVFNNFPVMTPLRENTRSVQAKESISGLSFSTLQKSTSQLGVSVQAAIQASWCRVLASYLGEASVSFGVTLSGRTSESTMRTSVPCIVTLPVIARNYASNKEHLNQMMEYVTKMHKFRNLPLAAIQKALGHPGSSVFDTLVAYQKANRQSDRKCWTQVRDDATVEYPVSIEVEPQANGEIVLRLTYVDDVLPPEQASLLLEQFDVVLQHLVLHPEGSEDDMHKQNSAVFSITPPKVPNMAAPVRYLHEFVERRAVSDKDKVALEHVKSFENGKAVCATWTFGELDEIGNRVANMLRIFTKPNSIIAIHFDKCPEAYFAILGVLKSGSSFVALDPNAPSARKEFILQDSNAPCLLTDMTTSIEFDVSCPIIKFDEVSIQEYSSAKCEVKELTTDSTCYCLYTSGTTGTPKGCEITHENTVQCMMAFQDLFKGHWTDESRWLQFAALHFDVSVLEQYWSWSVGMTVVAARKDMILDDLLGFINALQITHIDLTPSLARLTHPDTVPTLCKGIFITGGEQLKQEILEAWGPQSVIYNAYGPTEATIGVTMYKRVPQNGRPSNIGQQFPNVGSYVFRQGTEIPVLRGGVGELCVSGKLVGKGYLNRPELTDDRFPTLETFGERIYRTGDLVRILHDGCFEFLGRADDQVKLRGQRLEIGEIDHVIRSLPCIHDGATIITKHASSGKDVLVAFVVGEESKNTSLSILPDSTGLGTEARNACREKLPGYMVPSYFLRLPFIPLSPNNKAEAKVLKALFGDLTQEDLSKLSASSGSINNGNNSHLKELIESVAEFCAIPASSISNSTSIFDIGIDSISALQLSSFLKQNGFPMTAPALVLKNPILGDLSTSLSAIQSKDSSPSIRRAKQMMQAAAHKHRAAICRTLSISTDQIVSLHPCSSLQQGIIAKAMTGREEGAYFNSFQMLLHPDASIESLKDAWEALAQDVPILRSVFVNTADGYMQVTTKQSSLPWSEHTLTKHDDLDVFMRERRRDWISANEEIISEPLQILHVEYEKTRRLVIHIFHAVYDGGSFDLILRNIQRLYDGKKIAQGPTFADTLAHGPLCDHTGARGGWVEHLANWRSALLDIGPGTEGDQESAISTTAIIELGDIEYVRQKHNLTVQSVLLGLWTATLRKYSATAPTAGVIVSGRTINLNGVQDTIGPLFNTLPFFSGNLDTQTWPDLLKRCQRFNGLVLEDPHVPLQDIQKWCSGGQQLFDNLFTYQVEDIGSPSTVPWTVEDVPSVPDYPLALEVTKLAGGKLRLYLVAQAGNSNTQLLEQILGEFNANITLMQGNGKLPTAIGSPLQSSEAKEDRRVVSREDSEFEWTAETLVVRQELASLANVPESEISPSVSILELGLDSIDVIQLTSRLRSKGIMIPASQIMKAQTITGISERIEATPQQNQHHGGEENLQRLQEQLTTCVAKEGIALDTVESVLPPTPLQEAMVSGMMQSDFNWYFNHEVLEIANNIDIQKLKLAWRTTIKNSPILRTGFVEISDLSLDMSYAQVVYKQENFTIETAELKSTDEFCTIIEQANQKARASNGKDHLVQLTFAMVESKVFVIFSIAHALYDGWSLSLIHQDLQNAYNNSMRERPLPDNFIVRSMESWTSGAEQFWANYLDSAHTTTVAQQHSPEEPVHRTTKRSCNSLFEVNAFCKGQNISLQALLQACWAVLLAHRANTLDVVFGAVLSGRDFEGADDLMFPTMNTVAVRCILHGTVGSFLRYVEGNLADIREYQSFPLRKAQAAANLNGEFFDSIFLLQKAPASNDLQQLFKTVDGSAAVDYPVCVEAEPIGDELMWTAACQRQVESKVLSETLVDQLDNILRYLITHEDEDVVAFGESKVSISGMPYISLQDDKNKAAETPSRSELAWNETALSIRATLSSVSNVPEGSIQISSTLYHLGLDSITAIKVSSLLKRKQLIIKPTELVRATSIGEIAEIIDKASDSERGNETDELVAWHPPQDIYVDAILHRVGILQEDIEMVLPATPMQVHMTTVWQNTEGKVFYPTFWYRLTKPYAVSDVEAAWEITTQCHALLRTCLVTTGDEDVPMLQAVLKKYVSPSRESAKPLAQLTVHHDGDSSTLLCLHIHHALYDGVSLPVIMDTLSKCLGSQNSPQDENIIPWSNYSIDMYSATFKERRRAFWSQYLSEISTSGSESSVSASASRTSFLRKRALEDVSFLESGTKHGISIQAVAFAAFARSIANSNTVIFGIYLANRATNAGIPTTFPTLNLAPLKVNVSPGKSLLDVARQIQGDIQHISADGNADVGLWEIFSWTGVKISHFVNFLSLPDSTDDDSVLVLCEDDQQQEVAAFSIPTAENNAVRRAYPASMDVEMSVKHGALDIGVFGPSSLVTDAEARDLVRSITSHLEA
ncbi:NRPS [Lecanicillium sp. MT-2017a]|nr:NRPS [Lecanicillium sp. MT-2017a]